MIARSLLTAPLIGPLQEGGARPRAQEKHSPPSMSKPVAPPDDLSVDTRYDYGTRAAVRLFDIPRETFVNEALEMMIGDHGREAEQFSSTSRAGDFRHDG